MNLSSELINVHVVLREYHLLYLAEILHLKTEEEWREILTKCNDDTGDFVFADIFMVSMLAK